MVFLDADALVAKNIDDLFKREEISAVTECAWPYRFNSGVFVFQPSVETFNDLIEHARNHRSFDCGDQALLNSFFSDWSTKSNRILPFGYNDHVHDRGPDEIMDQVKLIRFPSTKPWKSKDFNLGNPPHGEYSQCWQLWWSLFESNSQNQTESNRESNLEEAPEEELGAEFAKCAGE